jgi:pyridinium-3,5-bisthiocarboxylic acid mononucleotide nickel chelatase
VNERRPPHGHGHAHGHGHGHADHAHGNADHAHGHADHAHEHADHAHGNAGDSGALGDPERHREPLARGAGRGKVLFLDAFSGIAGDMTIAALVDLGVPLAVVQDAVTALGLTGVELVLTARYAGAIGASHFDVRVTGAPPERHYREIDGLIAGAPLEPETVRLARAVFRTLAEAEAHVHRISIDEVHFHEVGAVDAIVDIVGAAACFAYLGADVVCSPLPLGRGLVECRHGVLPLPAPATVECLRGVPTVDAGIEAELVTPTGAALARTVPVRYAQWPAMHPERIGWGRGSRDLPDRPNALRAVLGAETLEHDAPARADTHAVVEATVDDLTGELAGHAIAALLAAGALDAWVAPVTMKKGRPGLVLSAIAPAALAGAVAEALLRNTTTLGVRVHGVSRVERPREIVEVTTPYGAVPVKVARGPYGAPQVKPEFDVCARLAAEAGVGVRDVIEAAMAGMRGLQR